VLKTLLWFFVNYSVGNQVSYSITQCEMKHRIPNSYLQSELLLCNIVTFVDKYETDAGKKSQLLKNRKMRNFRLTVMPGPLNWVQPFQFQKKIKRCISQTIQIISGLPSYTHPVCHYRGFLDVRVSPHRC